MAPPLPLSALLDELCGAHRRLDGHVGALRAGQEVAPSRLPGWTRAHVLTHLARNADGQRSRVEGAKRGVSAAQYPGGAAQRSADIERGARRELDEIAADVRASSFALDASWPEALDDPAWAVRSTDLSGKERTLDELPLRRWLEVEVHMVDLYVGFGPHDWPESFVAEFFPRMLADLPRRLPPGTALPDPLPGADAELLAWLFGRMAVPGLPVLGAWT